MYTKILFIKNSNLDVYPIFFPLNKILTHSSDVFIIQVSDEAWLYGEGKPFFSSISAIHSCPGSRAQLCVMGIWLMTKRRLRTELIDESSTLPPNYDWFETNKSMNGLRT